MSDKRQNQRGGNNAVLSTIAAVGIGALAAAGAFFVGKALGEEETEARLKAQQHQQRQVQAQQVRHATPRRPRTPDITDDEDDTKPTRLEKECAICTTEFEELKRRDVAIHTTPCGHLFCAQCIDRCLQRRHECPTCRTTVLPGQTLRLFL